MQHDMTEQHCDVQLSEYSFFSGFFEKYFIHNMILDFYSDAFQDKFSISVRHA